MKISIVPRHAAGLCCLALTVCFAPVVRAQPDSTAVIEGRIANATNGSFLRSARVTVKGTLLQTLSDETGFYRLQNVPAGPVTLEVFFTGLTPQTAAVTATAGATVRKDFELARDASGAPGDKVELDQFIVQASREFNAQAIALNEQRFAENQKSVVSMDQYGDMGEGNLGEFVRYLPGVTASYSAGVMITNVSMRGFPPASTLISVDGSPIANAGWGGPARTTNFDFLTTNNLSRVEVSRTPTPDLPATMLGGALNVVSKSAFEYRRPLLSYRAFMTINGKFLNDWELPAPGNEGVTTSALPGIELSYVAPITPRFGFTVSANHNTRQNQTESVSGTWNLNTPTPFLLTSSPNVSTQLRGSSSIGGTADYKVGEYGSLSGTFQYVERQVHSDAYSRATALGANPTGNATSSRSTGAVASMTQTIGAVVRFDRTTTSGLKFRHRGPIWNMDASLGYSFSSSKSRDFAKGKVANYSAVLAGINLDMLAIGSGDSHPYDARLAGRTAAGVPVDVYDVNNYQLRTVGANPRTGLATMKNLNVNVARHVGSTGLRLKTGIFLTEEDREHRNPPQTWTFRGPDGIAANADNLVANYNLIAQRFSNTDQPYGYPRGKFINAYKTFTFFKNQPQWFIDDPVTAVRVAAQNSTELTERIAATYLKGDIKFLDNRLNLVGGIRYERTEVEGAGVLDDISATYRRNANGSIMRDAAGRPIQVTTDPVELTRLRYKERGAHAERKYDDFYPSLNASYDISPTLVARASYSRTLGRPDMTNLVPGTSISDPDATINRITVRNTGLKPWTANSIDLSLERYFGNQNMISVGAFRKKVKDLFGSITTIATPSLLADYDLGPEYVNYEVVTQNNVSNVTVDGLECDIRYELDFLPKWGRGLQVYANGTKMYIKGPRAADLTDFGGTIANWGLSLNRSRFSGRLSWTYMEELRLSAVAQSATVPAETYNYRPARTTMDINAEYRLSRRFALYATCRNLTDEPLITARYASTTPEYARAVQVNRPGAFITFGIKGDF
jgi:iron complex outermembrane receptor protein